MVPSTIPGARFNLVPHQPEDKQTHTVIFISLFHSGSADLMSYKKEDYYFRVDQDHMLASWCCGWIIGPYLDKVCLCSSDVIG
ncbi:hypothetical protein ElyMa_001461900 [Elysia marginata]|uniref:Uncharacterized protein n=1 Tax=Elysia marginata TaxID=1093978 RepID=A0AAV4J236_9GAST|nr:hypothetical protein ElyMa_001461900 [Elysia marginata]